jgi:hypothetical protein
MQNTTKAYDRFRTQSQDVLDYAALLAYALPRFRTELEGVVKSKGRLTVSPDYFPHDRSDALKLLKTTQGYESKVANYLWLSQFSFFEAFVSDIIDELFAFHGGIDEFVRRARDRERAWTDGLPPKFKPAKRKLQDSAKPAWADRYRKYARELATQGYRFPGDLFSAYGLVMLSKQLKRLKAHEIPDFVISAFRVDVPQTTVDLYNEYRETRNSIAHGNPPPLTVHDVVKMHSLLRDFAQAIQDRLLQDYFVIEKYL